MSGLSTAGVAGTARLVAGGEVSARGVVGLAGAAGHPVTSTIEVIDLPAAHADEWLEQMAIQAGFAVVVTLIAARLFRWDST